MVESLKNKIIVLRSEGKSYNEIKDELGCSKATISYHCNRTGYGVRSNLSILSDEEIVKLNEYYKEHSGEETMKRFNISKSTLTKYSDNKRINYTDEERKVINYNRVRDYRQKLKERSIEYKGGKCEKCGYNKCNGALEFHHLDPKEKDFGVGQYSTLSWNKIQRELDKCIMVCANCHREIHHEIYLKS